MKKIFILLFVFIFIALLSVQLSLLITKTKVKSVNIYELRKLQNTLPNINDFGES